MMEATAKFRQRRRLTLPTALREKYGIQPGDSYRLVDLDGVFVLVPMVCLVPRLAHQIEQKRIETGLSIDELLQGLREQREQYHQETFASHEAE